MQFDLSGQNMEYVVQALKGLSNLVHAETNARCPKSVRKRSSQHAPNSSTL